MSGVRFMALGVTIVLALQDPCAFAQASSRETTPVDFAFCQPAPPRLPVVDFEEAERNIVHSETAEYPNDYAGIMEREGVVELEVEVQLDGTVSKATVLDGLDYRAEAARSAALKYRFRPFTRNGIPVGARAGIRVKFVPNNSVDLAGKSVQEILAGPGDRAVANVNAGNVFVSGRGSPPFYLEAIRLRPDWYLPHLLLAKVYDSTNEHEKSLEHMSIVCRLRPDLPDAHLRRGRTLSRLGRATEAKVEFLAAKRVAKGLSDVVAACNALLAPVDEPAADAESRATELERLCVTSRLSLYQRWRTGLVAHEAYWFAQSCRQFGDDVSAEAAYRIAIENGGDDYYVLMSRVEIAAMLRATGRQEESESQLQQVLEALESARATHGKNWDDRQRGAYHFWKGVVSVERGDGEGALRELERSVRINRKANCSYAELGILRLNMGDWARGIDALRKSGLIDPSALGRIRMSKVIPDWSRGDRSRPSCATAPLRLRFF